MAEKKKFLPESGLVSCLLPEGSELRNKMEVALAEEEKLGTGPGISGMLREGLRLYFEKKDAQT